jgi:hypothetical protein
LRAFRSVMTAAVEVEEAAVSGMARSSRGGESESCPRVGTPSARTKRAKGRLGLTAGQ